MPLIGPIGLISLIGLIGLISLFALVALLSLLFPVLNRLKSVLLTPKSLQILIFVKKSPVISCRFGKRLYLCTRFRKRRLLRVDL